MTARVDQLSRAAHSWKPSRKQEGATLILREKSDTVRRFAAVLGVAHRVCPALRGEASPLGPLQQAPRAERRRLTVPLERGRPSTYSEPRLYFCAGPLL